MVIKKSLEKKMINMEEIKWENMSKIYIFEKENLNNGIVIYFKI